MSDHLPECAVLRPADNYYGGACICPSLRACEQRVREEHEAERPWFTAAEVWKNGRLNGLDAAREAIAAMVAIDEGAASRDYLLGAKDALASIDGLIWRSHNE